MAKDKEYFELGLEVLQSLGAWAADLAERALPIYEARVGDERPRRAIDGVRSFAAYGRRTNELRKLAMDAYRASLEAQDPAAAAAARAASLAASSAFTHPFKDANQAKHILGPAAYAALALELDRGGDPEVGDAEIRAAIACVPRPVVELLGKMPEQLAGKKRIDWLFLDLDAGIRAGSAGADDGIRR